MQEKILNHFSKLAWACRRGMLELDVLLGNFLNQAYFSLSFEDQSTFIRLLNCKDPDLFAWIMGHETPEDIGFAHLTELIRQHARSRFSTQTL